MPFEAVVVHLGLLDIKDQAYNIQIMQSQIRLVTPPASSSGSHGKAP
jgi:hypothetical protein